MAEVFRKTGRHQQCAGVESDDAAIGLVSLAAEQGRQPRPVFFGVAAVLGAMTVGDDHACALTVGGAAYCWGWNVFGQIGDGTTSYERPTPTLVRGGLSFRQISAGTYHTCGVTTANRAYCWGLGGHVGDGTNMSRLRPAPVAGGTSGRGG